MIDWIRGKTYILNIGQVPLNLNKYTQFKLSFIIIGAPSSTQQQPSHPTSLAPSKKPNVAESWDDDEEEEESKEEFGSFKTQQPIRTKLTTSGWDDRDKDVDDFGNDTSGRGWSDDDEDSKLDLASLSIETTSKPTSKPQAQADDLLIDWNEPASPTQPKQSTMPTARQQQDDSWASWGDDTSPAKPKPSSESWGRGSQPLKTSKASSLSPVSTGKSAFGLRVDTKMASHSGGSSSGAWKRTPAASNDGDFFEEMLGSASSKASSISSLTRHSPAVRSTTSSAAAKKTAPQPAVTTKKSTVDEGDGWDAW